jgi:hypothetical protein
MLSGERLLIDGRPVYDERRFQTSVSTRPA